MAPTVWIPGHHNSGTTAVNSLQGVCLPHQVDGIPY